MFTSCAFVVREAIPATPELAQHIRVEGGKCVLDYRCPENPLDGQKQCQAHAGASVTEDFSSRIFVELHFPPSAKAAWENLASCATRGMEMVSAEVLVAKQALRSNHPTFRPRDPVVKAKKVDLAVLMPILNRNFGYIFEVQQFDWTKKKKGVYCTRISFAWEGHYHIGPAGLSEESRRKLQEQLKRVGDVNVYRNTGFFTPDGKRSCLHVVEVFNSHHSTVEPTAKLSFNNGLWSVKPIAQPVVPTPASPATAKLGDNPKAAAALADAKKLIGQ